MENDKPKILALILLILWLGVFGVSPSYVLSFSETQKLLVNDGSEDDHFISLTLFSEDVGVIGARLYNDKFLA